MDLASLNIASDSGGENLRGVSVQQLQFTEKPPNGRSGAANAVRVERYFPIGSALSFPVRPTTTAHHRHADSPGQSSRDHYHPAIVHVDRGVRLRVTRAVLETDPGDRTSCGSLSLASDDNEDFLSICDFHKPNEERAVNLLGQIEVSGPRSIRLGIGHWIGSSFGVSVNVFGAVVADDRASASAADVSDAAANKRKSTTHIAPEKRSDDPEKAFEDTAIKAAEEKHSKKRRLGAEATATKDVTSKEPGDEKETNSSSGTMPAAESAPEPERLTKKQRKKLAKNKARELAEVVAKQQGHDKDKGSSPQKETKKEKKKEVSQTRERRLEGGVLVSDLIIGTGAAVKVGKKVSITYEGAFPDGVVFDKNKSKKHPLEFRPGTGEVIKGLERGLEGMKVGGERIITVPPELGYGKKGSGNVIPGNATLVFTVQLIGVGGR